MTKEQQKTRQDNINKLVNMLEASDELSDDLRDKLKRGDISIGSGEELDYLQAGWLLTTLIFTPVWACALYLSIKFPNGFWWLFPSSCYPGIFSYVLGFGLSELRERKA